MQPCPGFFHLPPSAHPFAFGADSRIGPDGSTTSTTWRPCRSQKCRGSCRACRSAKIASAANYRATHRVAAASRCADAITQHKRCDRSLYAGGTSYSVTGKTARVTGITARATCRAVLPSERLVPLPPLLRKELGRRSVTAVVRTGRSLPCLGHREFLRRLVPRADRESPVGRAAAQSGAASEQETSRRADPEVEAPSRAHLVCALPNARAAAPIAARQRRSGRISLCACACVVTCVFVRACVGGCARARVCACV